MATSDTGDKRNATQTRQRILDAALDEFSAKGYSGARTAGIAKRAGVNVQLISYYFGGKEGLLDALRETWRERRSSLEDSSAESSFLDGFRAALDITLRDPRRARLVVWQALGDYPGDTGPLVAEWERVAASALEQTRARQSEGQIGADTAPEFVALLQFLLAFAPVAIPQAVRGIYGVDPLSAEYRERVSRQLARLLGADDDTETG